jgi:hypothetical protein
MKRILAVVLFALSAVAFAQTPTLTGKWTIEWMKPGGSKTNKVTLTETNSLITGTYASDYGEVCKVSGRSAERITLRVECAYWHMTMDGKFSDDEIDGTYTTSGETPTNRHWEGAGEFDMTRDACWLPEGCGGK